MTATLWLDEVTAEVAPRLRLVGPDERPTSLVPGRGGSLVVAPRTSDFPCLPITPRLTQIEPKPWRLTERGMALALAGLGILLSGSFATLVWGFFQIPLT